jgi:hypothetical protein
VAKDSPEDVPLHERFRQLNNLDLRPTLWENWYAGPSVPDILRKDAAT